MEEENFLTRTLLSIATKATKGSLTDLLDLKGELELSLLYDQTKIQDSYTFRLQRRAFLLSNYLIDDKGKFDKEKLDVILYLLEKEGFIFYSRGFCDFKSFSHMQFVLRKLKNDKSFFSLFQKFQPPLCHVWAEELVLTSVQCFDSIAPSEVHIKRAVLSACLTSLRQNVGSCFATAPAILIQQEQVEALLSDLYELLMTGKMKKVFLGVESSVPLSPSAGGGDLYKVVSLTQDLCFSPGLHAALEASQIFSKELNFLERVEKVKKLLELVFQQKSSMQIIELIHQALLFHLNLKEEDLIRYVEQNRSFLKSQAFVSGGIKKEPSSLKNRLSEKMLDLEKKAKAAFKACTDHALLKAWEFTLASFSESKMDFSRWNLYSSLGLHPEEKGGIGEVIYHVLQKQLEVDQRQVQVYDTEYQIAYDQVRATELLLKNASTESDIRRLQVELTSRVYHMRASLELRDTFYLNTSECSDRKSTRLNSSH